MNGGWNAPAEWGWAWVGAALVALYLFRPRHRPQPVAAAFLWRRVSEQLSGQHLWRRLQQHRLLWLQLLFSLLVIAALARPYQVQPGLVAPQAVLLIDTSASMNAGPPGEERWRTVLEEARQLVSQAPRGTEFLLAAADQELRLLQPFSSDRRQLLRALEQVQPRALAGREDLLPAFALSLLKTNPQAQLHWFSDHALAQLPHVPHLAEQGQINAGIESFQARDTELFVALRNQHSQAVQLQLTLEGPQGFRIERHCSLKGDGRAVLTIANPAGSSGRYTARLSPVDDFAWDNQAWAQVQPQRRLRLVQHGQVSPYLEAALQAATGAPVVRSETAAVGGEAVHLWARLPDQPGPGLHFASAPPLGWVEGEPVEDEGPILLSEGARKRLALRLRSQRWGPRLRLKPGAWEALLQAPNGDPLLVRHEQAWIWLFALENSELPLSPELPVLLSALLAAQQPELPAGTLCGTRVTLPPPAPVEISGPSGRLRLEQLEWMPVLPGWYEVGSHQLAANFHAPEETDLDRPKANVARHAAAATGTEQRPLTREFSLWLAALALLVLLLEFRYWWSRG